MNTKYMEKTFHANVNKKYMKESFSFRATFMSTQITNM